MLAVRTTDPVHKFGWAAAWLGAGGQINRLRDRSRLREEEKAALLKRKELLENDPLTVEIEARKRLKYVKKDETVYIIENWNER